MAVGDAHVFTSSLTPVLTQRFFPKPQVLFLHASAEVRGENTPERKVASTGDQTLNHQVMGLTRSPLSHPGGAENLQKKVTKFLQTVKADTNPYFFNIRPRFLRLFKTLWEKEKLLIMGNFFFSYSGFYLL